MADPKPPLIVPAGYAQVNLKWQAVGAIRPVEVTMGTKPPPAADAADIAVDFYGYMTAANRPGAAGQMNTSWTFLGVRAMLMLESGPTIGEWMVTVTGTVGSTPVPSNCALLVRKNTASGGRSNRGRFYAPPCSVPEANVDQNGSILAATVTTNQTNWNNFKADCIAGGYDLRLFHTQSAVPTEITSLSVQSVLGTQRRRMRK